MLNEWFAYFLVWLHNESKILTNTCFKSSHILTLLALGLCFSDTRSLVKMSVHKNILNTILFLTVDRMKGLKIYYSFKLWFNIIMLTVKFKSMFFNNIGKYIFTLLISTKILISTIWNLDKYNKGKFQTINTFSSEIYHRNIFSVITHKIDSNYPTITRKVNM